MYNSSDIILYVLALIKRIATSSSSSSSSSRLESEIFLKCCVLYFGFVLKSYGG
jgi:hypothetical protein